MAVEARIPALLTAEEVAGILSITREQVYNIKHAIGFVQLGRVVRFRPADVTAYIDSHTVSTDAAIRRMRVT